MKDLNILIVGVGGQGTLLASVLLGNIALKLGYDVKLSEVHGMAQRGGSVVTHVRMSEGEVGAPVIDRGGADILLAFELLEGYRWVSYLKPGGSMFVNDQKINPMPVITGAVEYPANIQEFLRENIKDLTILDALSLAEQAGTSKAVNTVLLGAMAKKLPFPKEVWLEQIAETVKPAFREINQKAFHLGYEY